MIYPEMRRMLLFVVIACFSLLGCQTYVTNYDGASLTLKEYLSQYDKYKERDFYILKGEPSASSMMILPGNLAKLSGDTFRFRSVLGSPDEKLDFLFTDANGRSVTESYEIKSLENAPNPESFFVDITDDPDLSNLRTLCFIDAARLKDWKNKRTQDSSRNAAQSILVSTDGSFKLFVVDSPTALMENRKLFALAESQFQHRPVSISFACDRAIFDRFVQGYMISHYELIGSTMTESYFLDHEGQDDYVIITSIYPPGLILYFMDYEYFSATH
jgi:hypothetical protein